ncbi:ABC-type glycerol-3-phosphate transport system, substrate-binding protein [Maridesulfovibrio ferrireducens]|uniref:ABC-type glycerol-3-phosphate transport system, substrate-binding protein n=1 Tax=Maridesulfovibrio ferrireducens TaxID=246191 RepID=A0A1G9EWR2_9BACT|nr:extracellular solute-binding protein [Maridesulfovibrio ferrireducens]SDK80584.1 ABC-type glycerol-3-phosphate transport system, substrate-binding protein [Maridesulfovibrio ferrireducens]
MKFIKILILATALSLAAACAKTPTPENPAELTIFGDVNRVFIEDSKGLGTLNDFMTIHPEIKVRTIPEYDEWQIHEQSLQTLRNPTAEQPDIIEMPGSWVAAFTHEKLLLPIESWFKELPIRDQSDFLTPLIAGYSQNDELYGLPALVGVQYLYARKDLLPESGMPHTLDDLVTTSRFIKEKYNIQGIIFPSKGLNLYKFYYTLLQIELHGQESENRLAAHRSAYKNFAILVKENQPDYEKYDHPTAEGEFRSGRAGLSINGNYVWFLLSQSSEVGFPVKPEDVLVDFLPVANKADHKQNHIWTRGYVINNKTKHPEQALQLLHFLTSERADFYRLKNRYILPARKSAAVYGENLPGMAPKPAQAMYEQGEQAPEIVKVNQSTPGWYGTASATLELLKDALAKGTTPESVAEEMIKIESGLSNK